MAHTDKYLPFYPVPRQSKLLFPEKSFPNRKISDEKIAPLFLVCVHFVVVWDPPMLSISEQSWYGWYIPLGIAFISILLSKKLVDLKVGGFFWAVFGLSFLGAALSVFRAPNLGRSLWNTVALGINFLTHFLFIPLLSNERVRRWILVALILVMILWSLEVQSLVNIHNSLVYASFAETGENKNSIGFKLGMAGLALIYYSLFGDPHNGLRKRMSFCIRFALGFLGIYLLYTMSLIYARAAILSTFIGLGAVLVVVYLKSNDKLLGLFVVVAALVMIFSLVVLLAPRVVATSPYWREIVRRLTEEGFRGMFHPRITLLKKGWYLVSRNPILGVGVGGTKDSISNMHVSFPHYYIHNLYLTDWAERGILGLVSYIVWFLAYARMLRKVFFSSSVVDQIWMLLFVPLFFAMGFKDMSTLVVAMLSLLSGLQYDKLTQDR
jgi:O-antigen ligase